MAVNVFERTEEKYIVDGALIEKLIREMSDYLKPDKYGQYTICNIYLDSDDFQMIRSSIEKPPYKEKLRLRSYGCPSANSNVFLEIKKKYKGVVGKRRISIPLWEAENYIEEGIPPSDDSQIFREIDYAMKLYKPKPKLYLAYDRTAFVGIDLPDLRITFDNRVRSRTDDLYLEHGDRGDLFLDGDLYIMEIKTNNAMPLWLVHILSELQLYPTSFSKYGKIYQKKMWSEYINV